MAGQIGLFDEVKLEEPEPMEQPDDLESKCS
jgi:hypothetical protein